MLILDVLVRIVEIALTLALLLFELLWKVLSFVLRIVLTRLFGWLMRWNERRFKAKLLMEYEDLVKKRDALQAELKNDAHRLDDLIDVIAGLLDAGLEQRAEGKSAESIADSFDVRGLDSYENIRKKALEYEKTVFRLFVLRQKLKLYEVDGRVRESED